MSITTLSSPAPCGCQVQSDWPRGDRLVTCACGRDWIVRRTRSIEARKYAIEEAQS